MRGTFKIDPNAISYGKATPALQRLLLEWQRVDWFEAPRDEASAARNFREHNYLCHCAQPAFFAADIQPRVLLGGWTDFIALRERGARSTWSWKDSGLKVMTVERSKRLGYELARDAMPFTVESQNAPGCLIHLFNPTESGRGAILWGDYGPTLDLRALLPSPQSDAAIWYLNYAAIDVTMGIEWQLALPESPLEDNPFYSLTRCLTDGFYPFLFDREDALLFGFGGP